MSEVRNAADDLTREHVNVLRSAAELLYALDRHFTEQGHHAFPSGMDGWCIACMAHEVEQTADRLDDAYAEGRITDER